MCLYAVITRCKNRWVPFTRSVSSLILCIKFSGREVCTLHAKSKKPKAKSRNKEDMLTNFLCYILLDFFDVLGVMDLFDFYLSFDEPDYFETVEFRES